MRLLALYDGPSNLFTRLRTIDWDSNADSAISSLPAALFGPQLQTLAVGSNQMWPGSITAFETALAHLPSACLDLQHLVLRFAVTSRLAETIANLGALRSLDCGTHIVPVEVIRAAASLPRLRTLQLSAVAEDDGSDPLVANDDGFESFPELRSLDLVSTSGLQLCGLSPFLPLLRKWPPRQLSRVYLCGILVRGFQEIATFIATLGEVVHPDALRAVKFEDLFVSFGDDLIDLTLPITLADLQPLFTFRNLEILELDSSDYGNPCYIFSDGDFAHFAAAWPKLKSIKFIDYQPREEESLPSLKALLVLAAGCPLLETIGFSFDASKAAPRIGPDPPVNPSVRTLDVCQSLISDPTVVADFLCRLFPNLRTILSCELEDSQFPAEGPWSAWSAVREGIRAAQRG